MRQEISQYEVPDPKLLTGCCEFQVDSQSFDPTFSGPIDVRVEPKRIGFRWTGAKDWNWVEWHECVFFAEDPGQRFREMIADIKEQAREEGLRFGLSEAAKPPEERKPTVRYLLIPEQAKDAIR